MSRRRKPNSHRPDRALHRAEEAAWSAAIAAMTHDLADVIEPPPLWLADQARAAGEHLAADMAVATAGLREGRPVRATSDESTIHDALGVAAAASTRRAVRSCPHVTAAQMRGERVLLSLGQRFARCATCLRTGEPVPFVDDGRCDICDEPAPTGTFWPFIWSTGSLLISGDAGACCRHLVEHLYGAGGVHA